MFAISFIFLLKIVEIFHRYTGLVNDWRCGIDFWQVIVETSLGKEEIKSAISACTNKVK